MDTLGSKTKQELKEGYSKRYHGINKLLGTLSNAMQHEASAKAIFRYAALKRISAAEHIMDCSSCDNNMTHRLDASKSEMEDRIDDVKRIKAELQEMQNEMTALYLERHVRDARDQCGRACPWELLLNGPSDTEKVLMERNGLI
ncbi:hypothetical protein MMC30_004626 [Trapelia coarctata]|nr:hypothetical protein [Trapelia coarctata]